MARETNHGEWLSLIDISGPFLSLPVLEKAFSAGLDQVSSQTRQELRATYNVWLETCGGRQPNLDVHVGWVRWVLRTVLRLDDTKIHMPDGDFARLSVSMPEYGEVLRPDLVIADSPRGEPRILVQIARPGASLEHAPTGVRWQEPYKTRMQALLHGTGVRLGLLTNGEQWMLVDAPAGETVGFISWYARLWLDETITLQAFASVLGADMLFWRGENETLEALLKESSTNQQEVTDQLGYQVRQAVELLIASIDRVDRERGGALLAGVTEAQLYEAALTVMMRLVFLLSAEERGLLLPPYEPYVQHYAVSTLLPALQEQATSGEEVLERRHDAWVRLLATFRAIYGGIQHPGMASMPYGGSLFDPDRFPFLEGRSLDTPLHGAHPLPISNRVVLHILRALQLLQMKGKRGTEARRLSFRALGVEQIGHVYEQLLDHTAKRATTPVLGLEGNRDNEPEVALSELEALRARGEEALITFLNKETKRSPDALAKALRREPGDQLVSCMLAACGGDEALFQRVRPFAGLIRLNSFGRPVIIPAGSVYVTAGEERRSTGAHYTPVSLTEPIVRYTLEPLVYDGPAEGKPRGEWRLVSLSALLRLTVCDMAMGSGAFLVQACRYLSERVVEAVKALPQGQVPRGLDESARRIVQEIAVTENAEEALALARRLVVDRCLYGVDKNPLAVNMAKLSLWLLTLDKERPFTFLDHALGTGDSLLGISHVDQLLHWSLARKTGPTTATFLTEPLRRALQRALALRRKIRETPVRDVHDAERKAMWLQEAEEALGLVKLAADLLVAAALHPDKKRREELNGEFQHRMLVAAEAWETTLRDQTVRPDANRDELAVLRREADDLLENRPPFHWPLEFPEVFIEEVRPVDLGGQQALSGFSEVLGPVLAEIETPTLMQDGLGFQAIVGNPPFQGGKKITGGLGVPYRDYLVEHLAKNARGNADLCAYFFLRAGALLCTAGQSGMIATNTIAQGDTREVGLDQLAADGFRIPRAVPSRPWPGLAAVEVAHVWVRKGDWRGPFMLDEQPVAAISPFLTVPGSSGGKPERLKANEGKSFQGSIVLGMGFVLTPEEARALIERDPRNREVLFPYLNGEDLNSRLDQSPSRLVINFQDRPLEHAKTYPDLIRIVHEKVKPQRDSVNRKVYREVWWQYAEKQKALYNSIADMKRVIVVAQVSRALAFEIVDSTMVFSHKIIVFVLDKYRHYCVLQSNIHSVWAWEYSSTMKSDLSYTPTDCFLTFPFPAYLDGLDAIGEAYHEHRRQVMLARQEGLTKTYNRFHDRKDESTDVVELRRRHVTMDQAVVKAYGWNDLDLGHGFHETKQGLRYTISESARRTVLDRLLALNHQRHAEEVEQGLHDKGAKKAVGKRQKANASGSLTASVPASPQLALDLGEELTPRGVTPRSVTHNGSSDAYAKLAALLARHGVLTNAEVQAALDVDADEARALLRRLVDEGLAVVEGQKRGTRYVRRG